jgi:hypothetical protein
MYAQTMGNTLAIVGMLILMTVGLVYPDMFFVGCLLIALGWVVYDVREKRRR